MELLENFQHWLNQPLFKTSIGTITLWWIISFLCIIFASFLLSVFLRRLLRSRVYPHYQIDKGTRAAYSRILHYIIMIAGFITAFNVMGINLTVLFAGGAALLVGIGFGVQNIANNFISGVIILFERPIKVGDYIEVDGILGTVQSISGRSSKILTNDQVVIIVPNSSFLEKNVINRSYTETTRIAVPIGVKYGSDLNLVKKVLLQVAADNQHVNKSPEPYVFCEEFGDSSIDMTLTVWIKDQQIHRKIRSELNYAIDKAFKENGIEIPFPQRDLHLKSSDIGRIQGDNTPN
ncbi:MAG: mechanosensitive ion channel family protein [Bacteroidia bacterium]